MKTIAFFNSKSGIGKTTLVYHLAWMYADLGLNVVAADLDPKANLTSLFLDEERLEELWLDGAHPQSILGTISPILEGNGDITELHLEPITENLGLVVGDSELFIFESQLSEAWTRCYEGNELTFRTLSAFYRALVAAFQQQKADVVLIDVSPSLSAINMAALIAAEYVVIPLVQNPLFMYGLNNLGLSLHRLREKWQKCLNKKSVVDIDLPTAQMQPIGYIILQRHPPKFDTRWVTYPVFTVNPY